MPKMTCATRAQFCATRAQFCATGCNFKKSPNSYTNSFSFCSGVRPSTSKYVQIRPNTSKYAHFTSEPGPSSHHKLEIAAGCAKLRFVAVDGIRMYSDIFISWLNFAKMIRNHWPKSQSVMPPHSAESLVGATCFLSMNCSGERSDMDIEAMLAVL